MKNFKLLTYILFFIPALILFVGNDRTFAQQNSSQNNSKIAFVDSRAFSGGITEFRLKTEGLEQEFKATADQLKKMNEQIQLDEEVLKRSVNDLTPEARQRKIDDLEKLKKDYTRKLEDAKESANKRAEVVLTPIRDKIAKALETYAQENGATLIIDLAPIMQVGSLAFIAPGLDVTDSFMKSFNQSNSVKN